MAAKPKACQWWQRECRLRAVPTIYMETALSLLRHLLTLVAGILVTTGLISKDGTDEFIKLGIGFATFAATVLWSIYQKHSAKKVLVTALVEAETSEHEIKAKVALGESVPSVLSPPGAVPTPQ